MRLLIDRYLANSLSGMELQKFIERLSEDELFRKEVLFQNLIVDAIRQAHDNQLQSAILSEIKYKKAKVPFGLRLIILFLAILISAIAVNAQPVQDKALMEKERQELQEEIKAIERDYIRVHGQAKSSLGELNVLNKKINLQEKVRVVATQMTVDEAAYLSEISTWNAARLVLNRGQLRSKLQTPSAKAKGLQMLVLAFCENGDILQYSEMVAELRPLLGAGIKNPVTRVNNFIN